MSIDKPALRNPQQHKLEVGTAVQHGDPPQYGTIKELLVPSVNGERSARIEWVNIVMLIIVQIVCRILKAVN